MTSKVEDTKFLKIQTYVLKVHIHCDGCRKKVKKLLKKIDGVYTSSVDAEQGKVTVSGSADSATLIKKLAKAGKHAELVVPKGNAVNNTKDNGKPKKGGGGGGAAGGGKDQKGQLQQQQLDLMQQLKGFKDMKLPQPKDMKDLKNMKFALPDEEFDDGSEFDDEFDDDYDEEDDEGSDDFDDDIYDDPKQAKLKGFDVPVKAPAKDKKSNGGGGDGAKKGGGGAVEIPVQIKGGGGGGGGGGKKGGGGAQDSKKGGKNDKGSSKSNDNGNPNMMMGKPGMDGMQALMSQAGLPAGGMPPPAATANAYQQQQYMAALMQQRAMMNGGYGGGYGGGGYGYGGGYPQMVYQRPSVVAPPGEPIGNYFSDDNPNGCSIM